MKRYKRKFKETHNVDISFNMNKNDIFNALFFVTENEDSNQFRRGWSQLNPLYKQKFIKQFK